MRGDEMRCIKNEISEGRREARRAMGELARGHWRTDNLYWSLHNRVWGGIRGAYEEVTRICLEVE